MELITVNYGTGSVNARTIYDFVYEGKDKKQSFAHWIGRAIQKYDFVGGQDFRSFSTKSKMGRPLVDYAVTIDMAKELAMIANTENGKKVRQYFIKCEKQLRRQESVRLAGIEIRKTLTDRIQESGENERMHGKGYSNFTRLVYSLTGLSEKKKEHGKQEGFRDSLTTDELKRVEIVEGMIKPLLDMDKQYSEIKDILQPLFEKKEIA